MVAAAAVAIYAENAAAAAENKPTLSFWHKNVSLIIWVAFIFSFEAELSQTTPLNFKLFLVRVGPTGFYTGNWSIPHAVWEMSYYNYKEI